MDKIDKIGFNVSVESRIMSDIYLEEPDGTLHLWEDLSPEGRLGYLARDAASYDIPLDQFIETVRGTIDASAIESAALGVVLRDGRELRELERLFPDDGRTESTPLVERVSDLLEEQTVDFSRLLSERRDDESQRPLHEKGVCYEDEPMTLADLLKPLVDVAEVFMNVEQQLDSGLQVLLELHDVPKDTRMAVRDYMSGLLKGIHSMEKEIVKERIPERSELSR